MQVFDLLTAADKAAIDRYISAYGEYSGYEMSCHAPIDKLLRFWDGAKTGFLSMLMGNQLILERHINISMPESILLKGMEDALYPDENTGRGIEFIENFFSWCHKLNYDTYDLATQLIAIEALTQNIYDGDDFQISVPNKAHPIQVQKGCKIMKILGKIAKTFNIEGFEDFRLKHSMVLNQKKFEGTLCLSIHPLDYMTMSDNDCDWDSCMSWSKPGEYREGTVEMMNSPYVLVAYLKAEKDMLLFPNDKNSTWNNKRWRELFVASPDVITGIKGYPQNDKILEREVFKWLLELVEKNCPWCHYEAPVLYEPGETFEFNGENLCVCYRFHIMYDDFYSDHTGYFSLNILNKRTDYDRYIMTLSGATLCLECGEEWAEYEDWDSQSLICPNCSGQIKCNNCSEFCDANEMTEMSNGDYFCSDCADAYARSCACCEDLHHRDNVTTIYMYHDGAVDTSEQFYLCTECFDTAKPDEQFGPIEVVERPNYWFMRKVNAINVDKLTLEGFRAFGYYAETVQKARELV